MPLCPLIFFSPNDAASKVFKASYSFSGTVEVWHNNLCFPESDISVWLWEMICVVFFFKIKTTTYFYTLLSYWQHLSYKTYLSYNGATLLLKPIRPSTKHKDKYSWNQLNWLEIRLCGWLSGQNVELSNSRIVWVRSGATSIIIIC